jgi:hypothetical protein
MSNDLLKLLNSLNNNKSIPQEDIEKKIYEFFDTNRLNNEFQQLMDDIDKEKSHSSHIIEILKLIKADVSVLLNIMTMITEKVSELKPSNSFDTSLKTLTLSQKLVCQRIQEGCFKIIEFNNEKDKNLDVLFNNYASKFIDFNELMHQKGTKILIIDGQNINLADKKKASLLLNQIDIRSESKDSHPNSNDKAFAFIETNKNTINISCENTSLILADEEY